MFTPACMVRQPCHSSIRWLRVKGPSIYRIPQRLSLPYSCIQLYIWSDLTVICNKSHWSPTNYQSIDSPWSPWIRTLRCPTQFRAYSVKHWHPMMTSSNGNIFRVTGHLCGNSPVPGEFPTQKPVTRSFDVFFDLRLNKRLSKQSWGRWLETSS